MAIGAGDEPSIWTSDQNVSSNAASFAQQLIRFRERIASEPRRGPWRLGFYARDHLGSIREIVMSDGTTVGATLSYDPCGQVSETGALVSDETFTGHYYDRSTTLNLAWYRGYDGRTARWLSNDPLGILGGVNLYAYVRMNP